MSPAMRGLLRGVLIAAIAGFLVFTGLLIYERFTPRAGDAEQASAPVQIGGAFSLTDQDGKPVTDKTYAGKLMLVYFGFTSCPDICPTALQNVAMALDDLGPATDQIATLLITVDPERDTPQAMKEYVQSFHPTIQGLTGTPEQIAAAARAYRVYYQKVELKNSSLGYSVDHSGFLYLMDRNGKYLAHFRHDASPEEIAKRIRSKLNG